MATPQNETSIEEIQFVTAKTVFPHVALDEALTDAIDEAYALAERGESHYVGEAVTEEELTAAGIKRPARVKRAAPMPKLPEVMPDVEAGVVLRVRERVHDHRPEVDARGRPRGDVAGRRVVQGLRGDIDAGTRRSGMSISAPGR